MRNGEAAPILTPRGWNVLTCLLFAALVIGLMWSPWVTP